ncbi:MAG TPA: GAF domain-containing protein [Anaerolineae bacterium]|nr:GAF domain-containing protein [Anaerolineae bacterium]
MASSIRLLLVEPNESDRRLIRKALRGRAVRFRVFEAPRPEAARAQLGNDHFDLALVDLDGWPKAFDAFDTVHTLAPALPILALSRDQSAADVVQRGAAGFVAKTEADLALLHLAVPAILERAVERAQHSALLQQVRSSENRYRLLFDGIQDALCVCDAHGLIIEVNRPAEQLLERSAAELLGAPWQRWIKSDQPLSLAELAGSEPVRRMLRRRRRAAPVEVQVSLLTLDNQAAYLIVLRDLRREARAGELLHALTTAAAAMQGALTSLDVFRAAGEQLRTVGLILSVFRLVEGENTLMLSYTHLATHVLEHTLRITGLDPLNFRISVAASPILQSILHSETPLILPNAIELIREMLPQPLKPLARPLQKVMNYREQFGLRLRLEGQLYGLIVVGYPGDKLVADDQPVIEAFASQIQAALERARRFEATQARLAAKLQELTQLVQVSEQLQLRLPLNGLLDLICQAIRQSLGWERVTVWLRDPQTLALSVRAAQGPVEQPAPSPAPLEETLWRKTEFRIGHSYFVPCRQANQRAWLAGDLLVTPIEIGGDTLGLIQADRPANGQRPAHDDLVSLELFANQAAVAIENALLYERANARLQQRTDELTALTTLATVADPGDLQVSLDRALEQVLRVSGMEFAIIVLREPAGDQLLPYVGHGLPGDLWDAARRAPAQVGEDVGGRALADGCAIVVTDVMHDPRVLYRELLVQHSIQTIIGIGLVGRDPIGAMLLYARSVRRLSGEALDWLAIAGRQIALSIENTRLIEATRRRQQMAEAVREVNAAVASNLELDAVLATVLDQVGGVAPYLIANILLVEAAELRVIAARGLADAAAGLGQTYPRDEHDPGWQAVLKRQTQVIADLGLNETWGAQPAALHIGAWVGAPLIVHNKVIGLLTLQHDQPGFYREEDVHNVSLIAQQAAVAIDNARRFQMERERSERMALLNDLGRELIVALDEDTILSQTADRIAGRFGPVHVDVFMVDAESDQLVWRAQAGPDAGGPDILFGQRFSLDEGIIGHAATTGQTYFSGHVNTDPYYVGGPPGRHTRSEVAVPLRIEEHVVGVLNIESDRLTAFDADDVAMLETLAGQVNAALSLAQLYQETQQRAVKLSTLFAASQEFGSSLDSDQVLGRLAQWVVSAVDATSARVHTWDLPAGVGRLLAQYVGVRANPSERQSMIGVELNLGEVPELVAAMKSRQPATYTVDQSQVDLPLLVTLNLRGVLNALYLPLVMRERLIGCVEVWETEKPRRWQPEEVYICQTMANVAAGAIDNARLFEAERQRRAVAETVRDLAAVVSSSLELQPILEALLERAAELLPYDSAAVFISAPQSDGQALSERLHVAASRGRLPEFKPDSFHRLPGSLAERLLHSPDVIIYENVQTLAGWTDQPGHQDMHGWLGVPLQAKGQISGVLAFASQTPGRYRREHAETAQTIASHAAVAIENARLYQETRQRLAELLTLQAVSLEMSQSLDVKRVSQAVTDGALRLLKATAVHLFSFDAEADFLHMVAKSAAPGYEEVGQPTPRREGLTMQVARTSEIVVINDPQHDPRFAPLIQAWPWSVTSALASLPLQIRGRVLGVINVIFHVPHRIDDNEVRIVGLLADQAATALENARLFEDEQKRRVAADVLREMSAVLTSTLNLSEVFERLFDQIARVIPYTSAAVLLLEEPDSLRVIAGRGFKYPEHIVGATLDLTHDTPSARALKTRKPLILDDVQGFEAWPMFPGLEDVHGWMGAPLIARDETLGTLSVDHRQPGIYRPEQAELLGAIANQAAAAITNARSFEQSLERERFASALGRMSLAITSTLELNLVLEQICRESAEAFNVDTGVVWLAQGSEIIGFAAHGPAREAFIGMRTSIEDRQTVGARVLHQRRGEFINSMETSDRVNFDLTRRTGMKALLAVPMIKGETPIGSLVVGDSRRADRFTAADIDRAQVLAGHAAIAIENARLFQVEQRRALQLALVNRVGLEVTSILDLDQLAQTVVEEIRGAFGYYHVSLMTIDGDSVVWRAGIGGDVLAWTPTGMRRPIGLGIIGAAAASGEVVLVNDVRLDPRYVLDPEVQHTRSELALPLKARGTVIGVLNVESDRVDAFNEEDVAVLRSLASQLSVAVENALLYQALAHYVASLETRVAERTAEIRREQERTFTILNSVADAVLVTDLDGAIVLTNPTADSLLHEDEYSAQPGRLRGWLRSLAPESGSSKIDVGARTLQAAVAYIREDDRTVGHVIVLRDITKLEEVDRLKTQFVSTVSHELRTPLTNVKLYLGLFQKGKPEKRDQYLATLQNEVGRLERLISDLLDLSRLERDRRLAAYTLIDLVEVLRHVVVTLEPQAEAKQQELRLEMTEPRLKLPADRNQMIQVFVNLTANAINYTPPGGQIRLRAMRVEHAGRPRAVVAVSDTGIGIPVEDQQRIFDRFYRGQAEHFEVRGTGLGLSIVKEIIEQHSGQITVESEVGRGSTFTVWLPMDPAPAEAR